MSNQSKIELKNENSNNNVIIKLEKISTGNAPTINHNNFKTLNHFLICAICLLIGVCITPTLIQKPDKNVFVKYNNTDSQNTSSKEKTAKNSSKGHNKSVKEPKHKNSKSKELKNKNKANKTPKINKTKEKTTAEKQSIGVNKLENVAYINNIYGNSVSNVLNGNFLAEENNKIYYIDYNDSNYVYRINTLNGKTELILDISCKEICLLRGKLYAIPSDFSDELIIYDLQTNEYEKTNISQQFLNINCEYIISCNESGIYKNSIDDIFKEIYAGDIEKCALYNKNIYFIEHNNLYSIDLDGNNKILIKENVQNFAITNSEIYYVSNNQLYSTNKENPLYDILLSAVNIFDNTIYFSNENDNGKLYSIDILTSKITKLSDNIAEKICVTKNKIAIITPEYKIVFI